MCFKKRNIINSLRRNNEVFVGEIEKPYEVAYVPLSKINYNLQVNSKSLYYQECKFNFRRIWRDNRNIRTVGKIMDGSWDLYKVPLNHEIYEIFKEKFSEGKEWEETSAFKYYLKYRHSNIRMKKCQGFEDYKKRYLEKWENIFRYKK